MRWPKASIHAPERVLLALCLAQLVLWTLAPLVVHTAPPLDVVEMYAWGREGVVATFKHPNLPGLVLEASRLVTGGAVWPSYVVSQAFVVAAFVAVYALGRDILGPQRALAGTLLLTGVFYYSWPTPEMNHNIAQIPLWAAIVLALWRATETGRLRWWCILGGLAGLVLWAKYSAILLLVLALFWLIADRGARRHWRSGGPWLALALCLLVAAPQIDFLLRADFQPLDYALARATAGKAGRWYEFLGTQLADHLVLAAMAATLGLVGRGALAAPRVAPGVDRRGRRFLTVMGIGPLALTLALAAVTGAGLRDMWGTPMFNLSGLLVVAWLPGRFGVAGLDRLARFAAVLLAVVPAAYVAEIGLRPVLSDAPKRANWPQAEIARTLTAAFERETGHPLRIVAGSTWLAGLVALTPASAPSVWIDADRDKAPWIGPTDVARHGVLVVWQAGPGQDGQGPPAGLRPLLAGRPIHDSVFAWSPRDTARPIRLGYAIVPPSH